MRDFCAVLCPVEACYSATTSKARSSDAITLATYNGRRPAVLCIETNMSLQ
jgi:hypothetical protein